MGFVERNAAQRFFIFIDTLYDNAVKLMEFLSGHDAQKVYADKNFEYPVEPGLEPSEIVKSFGTLNVSERLRNSPAPIVPLPAAEML